MKQTNLYCITDVGSTTTKAVLLRIADGWTLDREEAPTTVEKPHEDVALGVLEAVEGLEKASGVRLLEGGKPAVPYLSTSSAGGGLEMVVTGLVKDITAESADRVALGAGAVVRDVIAMNDHRTPYGKIEDLKRARPDMVLLAGGFDGDAVAGPVFLAELIAEAGLHAKLNPGAKLPVVYAGNRNAREHVAKVLDDNFLFHPVANLRPTAEQENLEPARNAIFELFMEHVMSQAPGYERLKHWVSAPILPTPAAFGRILSLVSRRSGKNILAIDIGGATTDVFTASNGKVHRTVSANLGMSYSILNVVAQSGVSAVRALLPVGMSEKAILNSIGNKYLEPTSLPASPEASGLEWAVATLAVRMAVRQHLSVLAGASISLGPDELRLCRAVKGEIDLAGQASPFALSGYDLIIGSGGVLSHAPRAACAMMLIDALQPVGKVELAADSTFVLPHLGVLSEVDPELAVALFHRLGIVKLATLVAPVSGRPQGGTFRVSGVTEAGRPVEAAVGAGDVARVPLGARESLALEPGPALDLRGTEGRTVSGGECGFIVDNRERPFASRTECLGAGPGVASGRRPRSSGAGRGPYRGPITLRRELAIPGEVFVSQGEGVVPSTPVARSVRRFLRPFFLNVAERIKTPPSELGAYLFKAVGDEIALDEVVAKRRDRFGLPRAFRSPVAGRLERILPSGTLVVREKAEPAAEKTAVNVAEALGVRPQRLKPYMRCVVGQEVEKGQWLAANLGSGGRKVCPSPVRGKVSSIHASYGIVLIEPLLEELEVLAWLPGSVIEVSERGGVIRGAGTVIQGAWGRGGEAWGLLCLDGARMTAGGVMAVPWADRDLLVGLSKMKARGLITAGLNLGDVQETDPPFTIVMIDGFGARAFPPDVAEVLRAHEGGLVLIDGTTQLRVGVERPRVIVPEPGTGGQGGGDGEREDL